MILLLDTLYAFFESVIYVMYLNIFLKNNQDMRIRNSLLVLILFVSAFVFNHSFLYFKILFLIDHQAQGEKYNSDNSKILDNFSESIGKDFVMYFEIFSIICVPVYL